MNKNNGVKYLLIIKCWTNGTQLIPIVELYGVTVVWSRLTRSPLLCIHQVFLKMKNTERWWFIAINGKICLRFCPCSPCLFWTPVLFTFPKTRFPKSSLTYNQTDIRVYIYAYVHVCFHTYIFVLPASIIDISRKHTIHWNMSTNTVFNSLWPSDAIWWHRYGSTLGQVMACCLTTQNQYLTQCWLNINVSSDHQLRAISREMPQPSITKVSLKIAFMIFHANLPGANELVKVWRKNTYLASHPNHTHTISSYLFATCLSWT